MLRSSAIVAGGMGLGWGTLLSLDSGGLGGEGIRCVQTTEKQGSVIKLRKVVAGGGGRTKGNGKGDLGDLGDLGNYKTMVSLPLEYRGAEIIAAEELVYDNGVTELHSVMDVGLGQEKLLLIEKFEKAGIEHPWVIFSAERINVYVYSGHLEPVKSALAIVGFEVKENRYGATVLCLRIKGSGGREFFRLKSLLEQILQNRGEIILTAPRGRSQIEIAGGM